ncbi:MAG TPA: patatin-like phospholipase family protein, partial [Candidatus Krumholzibacteria bacterium]|nr:patatin-like phospholipase family protein [Candidatus Krumholzibacteria bacterium]
AVRASMSIPGVFPPVEWDGRHLVDGYLARNLPVDVVRAMGADIVIAVDVGALPDSTDVTRLSTMSEIGQQTALIQSRQNVDPQVALADVVIRPDMPGITTRDFKLTTATIPLGEAAARGVADQLAALAVDPDAYARHVAAHRMPAPGGVTIERIEVKADAHTSAEAIRHRIRQPLGQYFYLEDLKEDLVHLYDRGVYELVDFSLARVAPGSNGAVLTVTAKRKVYAPHIVHFGLSYEAGETGRSAVNLRMRVSSLELNSRGAELRNDLQLGRADYLSSEYYQPLTMSRVPFVALRGRAGGQLRPWYYDFRRWGEYLEKEYSAGADLGLRLGVAGEIRGGVNYGHLSTEDRTGLSLAEFDGAYGGWVGRIAFDMMDSPVFPSHGFEGWFRVFRCDPAFGSGLDYTQAQGVFRTVTTAGRNTYGITFQGGSSLGTTLPEHAMFTLGGIGRLTAYASDVFRGESYGHAALMWYRHIGGGLSPYSTKWYVGASVEAGNAWREAREAGLDDLRGCASAFIGANTMLGPLLVTYGRAGDGHDAYYVTLGRVFSLLD